MRCGRSRLLLLFDGNHLFKYMEIWCQRITEVIYYLCHRFFTWCEQRFCVADAVANSLTHKRPREIHFASIRILAAQLSQTTCLHMSPIARFSWIVSVPRERESEENARINLLIYFIPLRRTYAEFTICDRKSSSFTQRSATETEFKIDDAHWPRHRQRQAVCNHWNKSLTLLTRSWHGNPCAFEFNPASNWRFIAHTRRLCTTADDHRARTDVKFRRWLFHHQDHTKYFPWNYASVANPFDYIFGYWIVIKIGCCTAACVSCVLLAQIINIYYTISLFS